MFDTIYVTLMDHMRGIVPPAVFVASGEDYGVRFDDPLGKSPSVSVSLLESTTFPVELGTVGTKFHIVYTIVAKSRWQRDTLKSIVYSGLKHTIPSGIIEFQEPIKIIDMPEFDHNRERFFWNAVINTDLIYLGD